MSSLRKALNELADRYAKIANVYLVVPKDATRFYKVVENPTPSDGYKIASKPNDPALRGAGKLLLLDSSPDNASMRSSATALFSSPAKRNIEVAGCLARNLSLSADPQRTLEAALTLLGHMYSNEGRSSTKELLGDPEVGWWEHLVRACEALDGHQSKGEKLTTANISAAFGFPDIAEKTDPATMKKVAAELEEAYRTRWSTRSDAETAYAGLSDALCNKIDSVLINSTDSPETAAFQHFHQQISNDDGKRSTWRDCLREISYDKFVKPRPPGYLNVTGGSPVELFSGTYVVTDQTVDLVWIDAAASSAHGTVWTLYKRTPSKKNGALVPVNGISGVPDKNDVRFSNVPLGDAAATTFVAKTKAPTRPEETGARVDVYRSDIQPVAHQPQKSKAKSLKPRADDSYEYDDDVIVYWAGSWAPSMQIDSGARFAPGSEVVLTNAAGEIVTVEVLEKEATGVVWPLVATAVDQDEVRAYDAGSTIEKLFENYEKRALNYVLNGDTDALMPHLLPSGEHFDSSLVGTYRDVIESLAACVKKLVGGTSSHNLSGCRFKELADTPEETNLRASYKKLLQAADDTGDASQMILVRNIGCLTQDKESDTVFCSPFHPIKLLWLAQADRALAALRACKNAGSLKDPARLLYATLRPLEWPRHIGDRKLLPGPAAAVHSVYYHTWIKFGNAASDGSSLEIGKLLGDFSKERPGAAKLTISVTGDTAEDGRGVHRSAAQWLKTRSDNGLPALVRVDNVASDSARLRPLGEVFREIIREEATPGELLPAGLTYTNSANPAPTDTADIGVHMAGVPVTVAEQSRQKLNPITVAPSGSLTQVALTKQGKGSLASHVEVLGDDLAEAYHNGAGIVYKKRVSSPPSQAHWNVYPDDQFPPCVVAAWPTENTDTILWDWLNPLSSTPTDEELKKGAGVAPRSQIVSCTLTEENAHLFSDSGVPARDVLKTVGAIGLRGTPIFTDITQHANGLLGLYGCLRALRTGASTRGIVPCVVSIDSCKGLFSSGPSVEEEPNSRADLLVFWADKTPNEDPQLNFCVVEVKYSDISRVPVTARAQALASSKKLEQLLHNMHDPSLSAAEKIGWVTLYMNLLNVGIGTALEIHSENFDRNTMARAILASVSPSPVYKVHDPVVAMVCPDPDNASNLTSRDVALGVSEVVKPLSSDVSEDVGKRLWALLASPSEAPERAHYMSTVRPLSTPRKLALHVGFEQGAPFLLEWDNKTLYPNVNTGVTGKMGSGKTQLLKTMLSECQAWSKDTGRKLPILVLDYKKDYREDESFVNATGAVVHDVTTLPLDVVGVRPEDSGPEVDRAARRFYNILETIYPGLGPVQEQRLVGVIKKLSGQAPITIERLKTEYLVQSAKPDALSSILDKFDGQSIFSNNQSDLRSLGDMLSSGGIHVIALDQLGSDMNTQSAVLALLLALYYDYMGSLEKKHATDAATGTRVVQSLLLVDEAVNVMKYKYDLFEKLLREGREYGVATILASQTPEDFFQATQYGSLLSTWIVLNGGSSQSILNKINMRGCEPEKLIPDPSGSEAYVVGTVGKVRKITSRPFHTIQDQPTPAEAPIYLEATYGGEVVAHGFSVDTGFTILAGSKIRKLETDSLHGPAKRKREELFKSGKLVDAGSEYWELLSDLEVETSSTAAQLIYGRSASGPETWRTKDGVRLKDLLGTSSQGD